MLDCDARVHGAVTVTGSSAIHRFRYLGGYTFRNGNNHFGYRYYNSAWGRFTQPDPTGQERNAYAYGEADPINNSDPTGAASRACVNAGVTSILGLLGTTAAYVTSAATGGVTAGLAVGSTVATVTAISNAALACRK
ncbi:RHS repeat-associated core domain-containing protein [Amycolatopsis sp. NPDC089917]|uniref:RHS repeat-associated core domain-containing protein n=1 Tax=Amycolatopsis sp. NPDC089917 TaxID=3155187 RepID=UPI00343D4BA0